MTLSPAWLDELRARTLLSTLIGRTIKVTKAGREFKACCPFHNEKTPSFTINDEKGFYHCFGCSAHGDAIRWMTDQRGLSFIDAVKELADAAGMEVPAPDPRAAERVERGNALYDVMAAAKDWFVEQFHGIEGSDARSYIANRGLKPDTVKAFGIGFAPESKSKLKAALAHFGDEKLVEAGLLIQVEEKAPYDRFRGRLMIPIRDPRGRVIAFGGRILGTGEPKYLNSPDTPLFDKGRTLYNLDRAGPVSRKTARMLVVEGYMDVIALAQAGIEDAVAPLGTALTEHQLERLWRMTPAPLLCFDGDNAGQKAAIRAIGRAMPAIASDRSLRFLTLPQGQDPDDVVRSGGRRAMEALIEQAIPLSGKLWTHELNAEPLGTPEARAGLKRRVTEHAQAIRDPEVKSQYLAEFRQRFDQLFGGTSQRTYTPSRGYRAPEAAPSGKAKHIGGAGIEPSFSKAVLAGLIRQPSVILAHAETIAGLAIANEDHDKLRDLLIETAYDIQSLESDNLIAICENAGFGGLVADLLVANGLAFSFTKGQAEPDIAQRDLGMTIEALASRPQLDAALAAATARLAENWDETGFAEQTRLLAARRQADQKLAALAQGEDD